MYNESSLHLPASFGERSIQVIVVDVIPVVGQYEQKKVTNGLILVVKRTNELSLNELMLTADANNSDEKANLRDVVSDLLNITLACISLSNSYVDEHQ